MYAQSCLILGDYDSWFRLLWLCKISWQVYWSRLPFLPPGMINLTLKKIGLNLYKHYILYTGPFKILWLDLEFEKNKKKSFQSKIFHFILYWSAKLIIFYNQLLLKFLLFFLLLVVTAFPTLSFSRMFGHNRGMFHPLTFSSSESQVWKKCMAGSSGLSALFTLWLY